MPSKLRLSFSGWKKASSNRVGCESNTSSPSSSVCVPSTSGTEQKSSAYTKPRQRKAVTYRDASTQTSVTTESRGTQVDETVLCDKAATGDERVFCARIKKADKTVGGSDWAVQETTAVCRGSVQSQMRKPVKSHTASRGRKSTSPDAMNHKSAGSFPNIKTVPKEIEPSPRETKSPLPHSPPLSHSSDKQPMANTAKRNAHLKQLELQHINNPKKALTLGLEMLGTDDWEKTVTGMNIIGSVVQRNPDILVPRLHEVCLTLILEVMNLRSCVSRVAMSTLGKMYAQLKQKMDKELEVTASALLQKVGIANEFIRQDVDAALDCMVQNCSVPFVLKALLAGGLRHLNCVVRKCTSQHLLSLVERTGTAYLLSDTRGITECILPAAARFAQDASQDVRHFGRQMLLFMATHPEFGKLLRKYVPARDIPEIRDIGKRAQEFARTQTGCPTSDNKSSLPGCGKNQAAVKARQYSVAQKEEYIQSMKVKAREYSVAQKEEYILSMKVKAREYSVAQKEEYILSMKGQMESKDFAQRIEAIDKIVADCKEKPDLVAACKYPVFDAIVARLQESNRKLNQHALEALQVMIPLLKDSMAQVVQFLVPAIVDNHLNSKINVIHNAADAALDSLIQHLDNAVLLEVLCFKAQLVNGKAKGHLIEKLAGMVTGLYPRQPQIVERKVLPLLWKLLVSSHNRAPTTSLCKALYIEMGQRLRECVSSQSAEAKDALRKLLQTF